MKEETAAEITAMGRFASRPSKIKAPVRAHGL